MSWRKHLGNSGHLFYEGRCILSIMIVGKYSAKSCKNFGISVTKGPLYHAWQTKEREREREQAGSLHTCTHCMDLLTMHTEQRNLNISIYLLIYIWEHKTTVKGGGESSDLVCRESSHECGGKKNWMPCPTVILSTKLLLLLLCPWLLMRLLPSALLFSASLVSLLTMSAPGLLYTELLVELGEPTIGEPFTIICGFMNLCCNLVSVVGPMYCPAESETPYPVLETRPPPVLLHTPPTQWTLSVSLQNLHCGRTCSCHG